MTDSIRVSCSAKLTRDDKNLCGEIYSTKDCHLAAQALCERAGTSAVSNGGASQQPRAATMTWLITNARSLSLSLSLQPCDV